MSKKLVVGSNHRSEGSARRVSPQGFENHSGTASGKLDRWFKIKKAEKAPKIKLITKLTLVSSDRNAGFVNGQIVIKSKKIIA